MLVNGHADPSPSNFSSIKCGSMRWWAKREAAAACPFCLLAQNLPAGGTSTLLYQSSRLGLRYSNGLLQVTMNDEDEKVVAFQDRNPSAYRHYLVIPKEHIPTVKQLCKGEEHYALVQHMLKTGDTLMHRDAPAAVEYRFGFHRPPFNSVNHLHLHCMALPFHSRWRAFKYLPLGRWGGYIDANELLQKLDVG
ncbi:hypothetical protein GOP47_0022824 [Adiantum capillus-veneris]|uniref:HIT domain-containing protein n=1 Tax=Adiantum capillus-veneris TaxID=13818 RepID=A0A9D4U6K2_ADICA|nr:hypothetical protein GOP47_0022824 [Adiantum capillus-veneris]